MADENKSDEAQTPLANAAERIRGSAQWILGAFAAVGALLAAGLQIASIGELEPSDGARFWIAFGGIAVAVIGIVIAVGAAASVSTQSDVSLHWLASDTQSEASKKVTADPALRQGLTVTSLQDKLNRTATEAGEQFGKRSFSSVTLETTQTSKRRRLRFKRRTPSKRPNSTDFNESARTYSTSPRSTE